MSTAYASPYILQRGRDFFVPPRHGIHGAPEPAVAVAPTGPTNTPHTSRSGSGGRLGYEGMTS